MTRTPCRSSRDRQPFSRDAKRSACPRRSLAALIAAACLVAATAGLCPAAEIYVAPSGSDDAAGTRDAPLATLQKAVDRAGPGDTVLVRGGTYRQAVRLTRSGREGAPIRLMAVPGETVVLSGTRKVPGPWRKHQGAIYATTLDTKSIQLFAGGAMMMEARWPNITLADVLTAKAWAETDKGSRYGTVVDPDLAKTGIDWTGAVATLNVAHQFFTWTRTVEGHTAGSDRFTYAKDLDGITHYADKTGPWEDDRYFLTGRLEALDTPGEWFRDDAGTLYLWAPGGGDPSAADVEVKVRDYALEAKDADYLVIEGFHFFAATFRLDGCDHCVIDGCHLRFPTCARRIADTAAPDECAAETLVAGSDNVVRNVSLAWTPGSGLSVQGQRNTVENGLVHDTCWLGSLRDMPLLQRNTAREGQAAPCITRHATVFNGGNALIGFRGWGGHVIEYNHAYNGGLACKDVALIYSGGPSTAGCVVRYNWAHGCRTRERTRSGLAGGLGIRGDDQTRSLTVHHNVVWDCGRDGIIVKGDHNRVCHNTVLAIGSADTPGNSISLHVAPEPKKWWRQQFPLLEVQNAHSLIADNAALTITGDARGTPFRFAENLDHNYQGRDPGLVDPAHFDFRPRPDSPLVDAGRVVEGITGPIVGKAPDIGAYEAGAPRWVPGYRNAIRVLPDGPPSGTMLRVRVLLAMPPLAPVTVEAGGEGGAAVSPERLVFTPETWHRPQTLAVRGGAAGRVRLRIADLGLDETVDPAGLDPRDGARLPFRTTP